MPLLYVYVWAYHWSLIHAGFALVFFIPCQGSFSLAVCFACYCHCYYCVQLWRLLIHMCIFHNWPLPPTQLQYRYHHSLYFEIKLRKKKNVLKAGFSSFLIVLSLSLSLSLSPLIRPLIVNERPPSLASFGTGRVLKGLYSAFSA